jgi:hypothetical protein
MLPATRLHSIRKEQAPLIGLKASHICPWIHIESNRYATLINDEKLLQAQFVVKQRRSNPSLFSYQVRKAWKRRRTTCIRE